MTFTQTTRRVSLVRRTHTGSQPCSHARCCVSVRCEGSRRAGAPAWADPPSPSAPHPTAPARGQEAALAGGGSRTRQKQRPDEAFARFRRLAHTAATAAESRARKPARWPRHSRHSSVRPGDTRTDPQSTTRTAARQTRLPPSAVAAQDDRQRLPAESPNGRATVGGRELRLRTRTGRARGAANAVGHLQRTAHQTTRPAAA